MGRLVREGVESEGVVEQVHVCLGKWENGRVCG